MKLKNVSKRLSYGYALLCFELCHEEASKLILRGNTTQTISNDIFIITTETTLLCLHHNIFFFFLTLYLVLSPFIYIIVGQ